MDPLQWPFHSIIDSNIENQIEFSSSFSTVEEISDISSMFPSFSTVEIDQAFSAVEDFLIDTDEFGANFNGGQMGNFGYGKLSESEGSFEGWSPSPTPSIKSNGGSIESSNISLNLPKPDIEIGTQLSVLHLFKAYGEAMENGQTELAEVIIKCLSEKVSLNGEPLLRLAYNLCEDYENQYGNYLKIQSLNNFEASFKACYQIFPYGKFAHLTSNSFILESTPADTETLHIVDFDMGEAIQWPPLLETAARMKKSVKITAVKWSNNQAPFQWSFEEARRGLMECSRRFGLNLKVDEIEMEDLVSELKKTAKRGGRREWLAFNCMVGLPHMGRVRSRKLVEEFLSTAEELIKTSLNRGIIIYGDGDGSETLRNNGSGFGSFFEGKIGHYNAMLESMECGFPSYLTEARMALECLFVTPFVSGREWMESWTEIKEAGDSKRGNWGGCRVSRESFEEGLEMVKGKDSLYEVKIGGETNNEMILEWRGNALVRVCAFKK